MIEVLFSMIIGWMLSRNDLCAHLTFDKKFRSFDLCRTPSFLKEIQILRALVCSRPCLCDIVAEPSLRPVEPQTGGDRLL